MSRHLRASFVKRKQAARRRRAARAREIDGEQLVGMARGSVQKRIAGTRAWHLLQRHHDAVVRLTGNTFDDALDAVRQMRAEHQGNLTLRDAVARCVRQLRALQRARPIPEE